MTEPLFAGREAWAFLIETPFGKPQRSYHLVVAVDGIGFVHFWPECRRRAKRIVRKLAGQIRIQKLWEHWMHEALEGKPFLINGVAIEARTAHDAVQAALPQVSFDAARAASPLMAMTDYPMPGHDEPGREAPVRRCRILSYDGNKYCRIAVDELGIETEVKSGYLYSGIRKDGEFRNVGLRVIALPRTGQEA